jgi:hypothetical protein
VLSESKRRIILDELHSHVLSALDAGLGYDTIQALIQHTIQTAVQYKSLINELSSRLVGSPADQHRATVELHGRKIHILAGSPWPNVPAEDVSVEIIKCANHACGEGFPIDINVNNRKRFHAKTCSDHEGYKERLIGITRS